MDCGDRREDVFVNDVDRQDLVKTLAEACEKTGWQLHAYCLRLMTAQIRVDKLDIDTSEVAA